MMNNIAAVLAAAFAAGILLIDILQIPLSVLYIAAVADICAVIIFYFYRPKSLLVFVAILFLLCGAVRYLHATVIPASDISHLAGQSLTVHGSLAEVPQLIPLGDGRVKIKYKAAVVAAETVRGQVPVTGNILVYTEQGADLPIARYNDHITVTGDLFLPHGYGNPGMVDTAAGLKRQGITARLNASVAQINIGDNRDNDWRDYIAAWRLKILSRMEKAMTPGTASILAGMLFGGYSGINQDIINSFAATGIVHILSVSGTHIALVAGVVIWLGGRMGLRRSLTMATAGFCIVLYAFVSGLTPPVVRSAAMGLIGLAAIGLARDKDAPTALMVTGFAMLSYQPDLIYDISFQLSFCATAGLIFLYPQTVKTMGFLPQWLASPLAVTLAAQLGVLPFLAWYFNSFSLSSFIANLLVVPIIEFTVVLGLGAAILGTVFLPDGLLWSFCGHLIDFVVKMNTVIASIPGGNVYLPPMNFWVGGSYYLLLAWIHGCKPQFIPTPIVCCQRWPRFAGGIILLVVLGTVLFWCYPRPVCVHFIDVGQGDAILVTTSHRRAILIDSGGTMGRNSIDFDIGERVVLPYLKHYGILEIDYLILTHGHQDHAGGSAAIAAHIPIKNIMLVRDLFTPPVEKLVNNKNNGRVIPIYKNQNISLDGVDLKVVHDGIRLAKQHTANEVSCVVKISYGNHSFLITGDLEAKAEKAIVDAKEDIISTVLKVGHHGAKTSTTPEFLESVSPKYAVISVGYNNRYGHPHDEVLKRLSDRSIKVYRTDEKGAVVFSTDGKILSIETFKK